MNDQIGFNLYELKRYKALNLEVLQGVLRGLYQPKDGERGVLFAFSPAPRIIESNRFEPASAHLTASERDFFAGDESILQAARGFRDFDAYAVEVRAANDNARLSPQGRHEVIVESTRRAMAAIGRRYAAAEGIEGELAQRHTKLYAVPTRDTVSAIEDTYLYGRFDSLNTSEQLQRLTSERLDERLLLALARVPCRAFMQSEVLKQIDEAWAARVRLAQPVEAAELAFAESANAWAKRTLSQLGTLLANPRTSATTGSFDRYDIFKTLMSVGAVGLLDFSSAELVMFERKLNEIAA